MNNKIGNKQVYSGLFEPSFANEPQTVIRAVVGETVNIDCNVDGATKQNPNFVQWVKVRARVLLSYVVAVLTNIF